MPIESAVGALLGSPMDPRNVPVFLINFHVIAARPFPSFKSPGEHKRRCAFQRVGPGSRKASFQPHSGVPSARDVACNPVVWIGAPPEQIGVLKRIQSGIGYHEGVNERVFTRRVDNDLAGKRVLVQESQVSVALNPARIILCVVRNNVELRNRRYELLVRKVGHRFMSKICRFQTFALDAHLRRGSPAMRLRWRSGTEEV